MEKHVYNISINAPREKVWSVLLSDDTYPQWTSAFAEGSRAETDWQKGSKVLFLDGNNNGMTSVIAENIPNEYLSIKHLGEVKNGVEDFESAQLKEWAGALENYTLSAENGQTELKIDIDVNEEWKDYFAKTWPKALDKVKELAEAEILKIRDYVIPGIHQ